MILPLFERVPDGATKELRREMYNKYVDEIVTLNPGRFLPLGVTKRWWHLFKLEHPRTREMWNELGLPMPRRYPGMPANVKPPAPPPSDHFVNPAIENRNR